MNVSVLPGHLLPWVYNPSVISPPQAPSFPAAPASCKHISAPHPSPSVASATGTSTGGKQWWGAVSNTASLNRSGKGLRWNNTTISSTYLKTWSHDEMEQFIKRSRNKPQSRSPAGCFALSGRCCSEQNGGGEKLVEPSSKNLQLRQIIWNNIPLNTGTNSQFILNKAWKVCRCYSNGYFGHSCVVFAYQDGWNILANTVWKLPWQSSQRPEKAWRMGCGEEAGSEHRQRWAPLLGSI